MVNQLLINDFEALFSGNRSEYGAHEFGIIEPGKKETGGKSWTVKQALTNKEYETHLSGGQGLGIIPITKENRVKFCVIDIDIYEGGNEQIAINAIQKNSACPLCVFRSKSGGYHLYLFFDEFVPAAKARGYIDRFIRLFAIDILCVKGRQGVEIFPKQTVIGKGQIGNWINLPYWNEGSARQKMVYDDRDLDLDEAVLKIKTEKQTNEKALDAYFSALAFADAPPCIQSILTLGQTTAYRNNFLFSAGVYFQKKNEDAFERDLFELNQTMVEPIPDGELEHTIIQSIRKKGYGYKCKDEPCLQYCNKQECKAREFGIGEGGYVSELDFGTIKQICTEPPYYEWEINGKDIRFKDEDEIIQQVNFRRKCMRFLHYAPYRLKDSEWIKIINSALANVEVVSIQPHDDISPGSMFRVLFAEFILDRPLAQSRDQIDIGRVWNAADVKKYYFRAKDLMDYILIQKAFRAFTQQEIHGMLRDMGCAPERLNGGSKQFRVISVPHGYFEKREELTTAERVEINFTPDELTEQIDTSIEF